MTHSVDNPLHHPEVEQASFAGYLANFVITVVVMTAALWVVGDKSLSTLGFIGWTTLFAVVAVLVQAYFLLHMNWSKAQVWHTVAMLMFIPLFVVMIGLTAWMFHGLYERTMIAMPPHTMAAPMKRAAPAQAVPPVSQPVPAPKAM